MSPLLQLARKAHLNVSRQWLVWIYTAVAVTVVLVLAIMEAVRAWA